jgi:hypothetical protein
MVSFTRLPLYPRGKSLRYPLDRRLSGPQSRFGWHGEVKILATTGTRTPIPWSSSPVASRYTGPLCIPNKQFNYFYAVYFKETTCEERELALFRGSNYLLTTLRYLYGGRGPTSFQDSVRSVSLSLRGSITYYLIGTCRGSGVAVCGMDMKSTRHVIRWRYDELLLCLLPTINHTLFFCVKFTTQFFGS